MLLLHFTNHLHHWVRILAFHCIYYALVHLLMYSYGDFYPVNNTERLCAIAVMLSTYIAYGLIMGRSATILASFSFRRQTFKQRFAIIRRYLVSVAMYYGPIV